MAKRPNIKTYTAAELDKMLANGEDETDWQRIKGQSETDLEKAIADDPDSNPPLDMSTMTLTFRANKKGVFLRLDPDVLEFFKAQGPGYQTRINAVLRAYAEAMRTRTRKPAAE